MDHDTAERASPGVTIVGVRGSREPYDAATCGMGAAVAGVAARIEQGLARTGLDVVVDRVGIAYPASSLRYGASRDQGVAALIDEMDRRRLAAPAHRFVLVGLSHGADVVRTACAEHLAGAVADRIAAVVLLGDPGRDPRRGEPCLHGMAGGRGILAGRARPMPPRLWSRTFSYCLQGDRVAGGGLGRLGALVSGTHTHYARDREGVLSAAADFACRQLRDALAPRVERGRQP